ncbi:hypothetical protein M513_04062 [Trichuris suis]|uniref:Uncharacterized protein n=1 Tax=Trichuris suis TaxID=68888 RepID=A0A085MD48_9BILA|nr:hypothetical protein M513_04062 [Trichuris suis]
MICNDNKQLSSKKQEKYCGRLLDIFDMKIKINIGLLAQLAVSNCREVRSVGTCVSSHLPTHYIHF